VARYAPVNAHKNAVFVASRKGAGTQNFLDRINRVFRVADIRNPRCAFASLRENSIPFSLPRAKARGRRFF